MAYRSSAKASSASGGTITATPPGAAAHDVLVAFYQIDSNTATVNAPTSWTTDLTLTYSGGAPDGGRMFYLFKADASGSDDFAFDDNNGSVSNGVITAAFSGRNNAAPHSTARVTTQNTVSNATPVSATIAGITASANDDIAVFLGTDQTGGDGRWSFSAITNYTERQDGVAVDWISGIALDTRDNVSSGATGSFSTTITRDSGSGNTAYCGVVIALAAGAGGGGQTVVVGLNTETDSAFALTWSKVKAAGLNTETDSALAATAVRTVPVGQATEADSVFATTFSKALAVGLNTETDEAFALGSGRTITVGQAEETDSVFGVSRLKTFVVGLAAEIDTALALQSQQVATAAAQVLRRAVTFARVLLRRG